MTDLTAPVPDSDPDAGSGGIDPRGPRVAAGLTCLVLAAALVTGSAWVLGAQVLVFAIGSVFGVRRSPWSWVYRRVVRPRLGPPAELEDPALPRFAQTIGLIVTASALGLALVGVDGAVEVGAGVAFVAAFLKAGVDFCLGCQLYVLVARARS